MADDELPPPPPPPPPTGWGPPAAPTGANTGAGTDDRTLATLAHAGQLLGGFLVPLIIYLVKKDESPFVAEQAKEALNFSITVTIASLVSIPLMFVLVGFLTLLATMVVAVVFPIIAAVAVNRGEAYRYPVCIRLVS